MDRKDSTTSFKILGIYTEIAWFRGVQPAASGLHAAQDGYEWDPTQNCKFPLNVMRFFCDYVFRCI